MVGGWIRLAGIILSIGSVVSIATGLSSGNMNYTGFGVLGIFGGLLLFAVGRIVADLFAPKKE